MEDITPLFEHYRECIRHLWNTGFRVLDTSQDIWELQEQYSDIASRLFGIFVFQPIGRSNSPLPQEDDPDSPPLPFLKVMPASGRAPIFINRGIPQTGYWDDPVNEVVIGEADLIFIRYFDFEKVRFRDFEYYVVRITRFNGQPQLVGRNALIHVNYATVFYDQNVP